MPTKLSLSVQYACNPEALPSRPQVRRWVTRALRAAAPDSALVTVRFVDAEEGQTLNRDYREKDCATNVLTFAYLPGPALAGDLALCLPVVLKEAEEQNKAPEAHFAHMVVHGMLHLQGFDHLEDAEAEVMETAEKEILAKMGYPDPYANEK